MFGGEEVVAPLAVDMREDAADVIVTEETVEDGRFIEGSYDETADIWDEGDECRSGAVTVRTRYMVVLVRTAKVEDWAVGVGCFPLRAGVCDGVGMPLEG